MLLIIVLILLLFGLPYGGYRTGQPLGIYAGSGLGLIVLVILLMVLAGRL